MTLTPVQTAVIILFALAVIGVLVQYVSARRKFAGFEYIAGAIRGINRTLKGEISRDGPDLLVIGEYQELPVYVRFSNAIGEAGLTLHMAAKAAFGVAIFPASVEVADAGHHEIRTGDLAFDNRFSIRTDQPTQVSLLFTRQTVSQVQKLCCSSQTQVNIRPGEIELTETAIPQPQTWEHVVLHLQSMRALAEAVGAIPGAESIQVFRRPRDRHIPGRVAIAIGVIAAVIFVVSTSKIDTQPRVEAGPVLPAGITPNIALSIPHLEGWQVATPDDFQPGAVDWVRSSGADASGIIRGDFSGTGQGQDVAYVLVNRKHQFRLVVIASHANRYDMLFDTLAVVGRIPKDSAGSIQWSGPPPESASGDGLLIVNNAQDHGSGVALFIGPERIASAAPVDYQTVSLR